MFSIDRKDTRRARAEERALEQQAQQRVEPKTYNDAIRFAREEKRLHTIVKFQERFPETLPHAEADLRGEWLRNRYLQTISYEAGMPKLSRADREQAEEQGREDAQRWISSLTERLPAAMRENVRKRQSVIPRSFADFALRKASQLQP